MKNGEKTSTENPGEKKLTQVQREVLVGILLGDGALRTESNGRTYRLQCSQSDQHKAYLFHLYEIFKNFVDSPPIEYSYTDPRNPNKIHVRWTFSTTQQSCFRFYGQQFYGKESVKKLPKGIHRCLLPRSIAYWYMDDGAQQWKGKSKGVKFCTDNFDNSEIKLLAETLEKKFQLKTGTPKQRGNIRISVSATSYERLKKLIYGFIIEDMRYKFPL